MSRTHALSAFSAKLGIALLLVVAADILFFEKPAGISLAMFAGLLLLAVAAVHPKASRQPGLAAKAIIAATAIIPLVENISGLSIVVGLIGLSAFALSVSGRMRAEPANAAGRIAAFLLALPFRLLRDLLRSRTAAATMKGSRIRVGSLVVWVVPLLLGGVFLALFGIANPVIEHWLSLIDFWALLEFLDIWRIAFWVVVAVFAWAFLRPRLPQWLRLSRSVSVAVRQALKPELRASAARTQMIFGKAAILRALILFNLMFAVQTVLDGAYLWGGVSLPDGLSYAAYAHRGAYPLIATALLAAVFVLVAMRPGSETSSDRLVRALVYLWTAQNFVLVISSILRLDLYVSIYSLTYLRVAAFIWMGLVAAGLVLITARIALGRSNAWLLSANLVTMSAVLYACCFINFAAIIAQYNVTHSREMGGGGMSLDVWYLRSLGPAAIPAMDVYLDGPGSADSEMRRMIEAARMYAEDRFFGHHLQWRAWTFRNWRLARYFDSRQSDGAEMPAPQR
jgi:hypothetical protein